jgi:hypothetical protein
MRLKKLAHPNFLFVVASMTRPEHLVDTSELARLHRTQGYSKIAVHFVIERDGSIHEGRPVDEPGCLAASLNSSAIQVCLIGGVDADLTPTCNFTPQQRASLEELAENFGLPAVFAPACPLKEL